MKKTAAVPIDALATMIGESEAPKSIAQGVVDFAALPSVGESVELTIPLTRPLMGKPVGSVTLLVSAV